MTVEDQYSSCTVSTNNLSATITNININGSLNYSSNPNHSLNISHQRHTAENGSVNSSMSSSSSSCSIAQNQNPGNNININNNNSNLQVKNKLERTLANRSSSQMQSAKLSSEEHAETGSSRESSDYGGDKAESSGIFVRIAISDQNIQVGYLNYSPPRAH